MANTTNKVEFIVALDIGTTKVLCLVADYDDNGEIRLVGVGQEACSGLNKGVISEIDINIIKLSKNHEMIIILTSKYRFFVRHADYESKLQEFLSVYDQFLLTQDAGKIRKNIDLRYPTGFAVQ